MQAQLAATKDPTLPAAIMLASAAKRQLQDSTLYYMYMQQAASK